MNKPNKLPHEHQIAGPVNDSRMVIRMPAELHEQCRQAASDEQRSLGNWVRWILTKALKRG